MEAERRASGVSERERRRIRIRALELDAVLPTARRTYVVALDEALRAFPDDVELLLLRGMAESPDPGDRGQGGTGTSVSFYERALARGADHVGAHHYLVHAYENVGDISEALRHAEIFARQAPAVPHAQHMYGHNLRRTGRIDEAIERFQKAYDLETRYFERENVAPEYDWHHQHNLDLLGTSLQYLGQFKAAEPLLRRSFDIPSALIVQELNKREWPAFLLATGRRDEALSAATTMAGHAAPLVRAGGHVMAGQALLALGRHEQAAGEANPDLPVVTDIRGKLAPPRK